MNTAALQYFSQITRDLSPEQFHRLLNIIKEIVAVMKWPSLLRHLRVEIWRSLHEIPIKSEGVFLVSKNQRLQRHQLIRRVDVYRGYQLNITFNFDLTPYIEGDDTAACWKAGRQTFLFENSVKSKVGGCIETACKSLKTVQAKQCNPKKSASEKRKAPYFLRSTVLFLVEITGIEPVTSCMPCKRSPSWAKPPDVCYRPWRR